MGSALGRPELEKTLAIARWHNLRTIVSEMITSGVRSTRAQAELVGLPTGRMKAILSGKQSMTSDEAREVEWSINVRYGWMDVYPHYEP